jgi:hypothetical protein
VVVVVVVVVLLLLLDLVDLMVLLMAVGTNLSECVRCTWSPTRPC